MEVIVLCLVVIVALPIVGIAALFGVAGIGCWLEDRKYKKIQEKVLSKEDWKDGLSQGDIEGYKKWLGY